jgi:preprotein translocase subunit SecD
MAYDRRKYGDAPANQPLEYVAIDPIDYVPLIIETAPEMTKDGRGKSILSVSLTRQSADRAEVFTRAHLGGKIAMVVDGEIVTLHKIREVITGGKLQITRCDDDACKVIRAKLIE